MYLAHRRSAYESSEGFFEILYVVPESHNLLSSGAPCACDSEPLRRHGQRVYCRDETNVLHITLHLVQALPSLQHHVYL